MVENEFILFSYAHIYVCTGLLVTGNTEHKLNYMNRDKFLMMHIFLKYSYNNIYIACIKLNYNFNITSLFSIIEI